MMASSRDDRPGVGGAPPLRADAQRNYASILESARDLFVERGAGAPLEEVARRAGVGIGTVYRRFPDRDALLRAVVVEALNRSYESAESARAGEGDGLDRLARYMGDALDLRISAVIPLALDRIDMDDEELSELREASAASVEGLIEIAHDDGSLPVSVTFADLGTLLVRLARPLPGGVPGDLDTELAHRHLRIVLAGLREGGPDLLDREGPSRADLRNARRSGGDRP